MQEVIVALLDFNKPTEVELDDAEAIASTRRHSRGVGWNNALRTLLSCAEPMPVPATEQPADYKEENNLEP